MSILLEGKTSVSNVSSKLTGAWRYLAEEPSKKLSFSYAKTANNLPIDIQLEFVEAVNTSQSKQDRANSLDKEVSTPFSFSDIDLSAPRSSSITGLYEGTFDAPYGKGLRNFTETFFLAKISCGDQPQDAKGFHPSLLPYLRFRDEQLVKLFGVVEVPGVQHSSSAAGLSSESSPLQLSSYSGFGKNDFGIFTINVLVNEATSEMKAVKNYISSKSSYSKKSKAVSTLVERPPRPAPVPPTVPVEAKRRRVESSRLRASTSEDWLDAEPQKSTAKPSTSQKGFLAEEEDATYSDCIFDETTCEVYEGDLLNKRRHGFGTSLRADGTIYEGQWSMGKEHGEGKLMTSERKVIYKGEFCEGFFGGRGTLYMSNGDVYEGEWRENLRHGKGEYTFASGCKYVGDWKENKRHGKGIFYWPDKSFYEGDWEGDMRQGRGQLDLKDTFMYEGYWSANYPEGKGLGVFSDGQQYQGSYKQGVREGRGSVTFAEGAVYEGRFREDKLDGMGTIKIESTTVGAQEGEILIPIVQIQADIKRIHLRAGFGDDPH